MNPKAEGDDVTNGRARVQEPTQKADWRALFNFTNRAQVLLLAVGLCLSIVSGIVIPALALFFGQIFDSFTNFGAGLISGAELVGQVSRKALWLVGLGSASWILNGSYFMFWISFGELQARNVRAQLFDGMLQKDMEWFDMRKSGIHAMVTRLQTQISELQAATSQPFGFAIQYSITCLTALGLAFYTAWNLTLVTIATIPFTAAALAWISAHMQPNIDNQMAQLTNASKLANNAIIGIDTVKALNGQNYEIHQYIDAVKRASFYYLKVARGNALQIGVVRLSILSMFVQGFWYGTYLVDIGNKTPGQVLTAFWGCLMATQTLEQLLSQMIVLEKGRVAGATLKAVLHKVEGGRKIVNMVGGKLPQTCQGDIQFRKVSFAYPSRPDYLALNKISLLFPAGETTFVIGRSGSGKSTLGNLLLQFYPPVSGEILLDGEPIRVLDPVWLRNNVTLVQQATVLFNGTVCENIILGQRGSEQVSRERVIHSINTAALKGTIRRLSDGLDTPVGMGGSKLSGGQRQRIAIARARLRDTPILILDEATSALDHTSRTIVMGLIREWRNGKTTIIITHDVSQIQDADYVYILNKGQVVQEGYRNTMENEQGSPFHGFLDPGSELRRPTLSKPAETEKRRSIIVSSSIEDRCHRSTDSDDSMDVQIPFRGSTFLRTNTPMPDHRRSRRYSTNILNVLPTIAKLENQYSASRTSTIPLVQKRPQSTIINALPIEMDYLDPQWETSLPRTHSTAESCKLNSRHPTSILSKATKPPRLKRCLSFPRIRKTAVEIERHTFSLAAIFSTVWPRLSKQQRLILLIGIFAASIHAAATPVFSWVFSGLLGTFSLSSGQTQQALISSISILGVALADASASYTMHYLLEMTGQAWVDSLRVEGLKRILDQPKSWFDQDENTLSAISECLDRNAEEMRNLVGHFAGFTYVALTMMTISTIWSFASCWKLTLVGLGVVPVIYGITRGFEAISGKWEGKSNNAAEFVGAILLETFVNIRTVRALTVEGHFHQKFTLATKHALEVGLRRAALSGLFFGLSDSSIIFATALIFYYGSVLAASGSWSTQDILTVISLLLFGISNVNAIIAFIPQINSARDTATRLLSLNNLPLGSSHEHTGTIGLNSLSGDIAFASATFAYPLHTTPPLLDSLTLSIPLRTSTAIAGPSGCGKSTVAALLLRLYPLSASTALTVGSIPLAMLHLPSWRELVTIVPQSPTLFPATIAENITYPHSQPQDYDNYDLIFEAASLAGIHTFIASLPLGYRTPIGDGGMGLSGGQLQRIAIARALIRKPQLLIMDEPTSALDAESAESIRGVIAELVRQGVTVVVITHSWEMMRACGNVVVLGNGKVVEQGTYDQLMKQGAGALRDLLGREDSAGPALN